MYRAVEDRYFPSDTEVDEGGDGFIFYRSWGE